MDGKPILVVEDDVAISNFLRIILVHWSWSPQMTFTIEEGRKHLLTGLYDHMILDLHLPDGDGAVLLWDILDLGLLVHVVVTSAIGNLREDELFSLGARHVLTKPYDIEILQRSLIA